MLINNSYKMEVNCFLKQIANLKTYPAFQQISFAIVKCIENRKSLAFDHM